MIRFTPALLSCTRAAGVKLVEIGASLGCWILQKKAGKRGRHYECTMKVEASVAYSGEAEVRTGLETGQGAGDKGQLSPLGLDGRS